MHVTVYSVSLESWGKVEERVMGVITLDQGVAVGDSTEMNDWMWHFFVPDLDNPEQAIHPDEGEKWMRTMLHVLRGWTMYAVLTE